MEWVIFVHLLLLYVFNGHNRIKDKKTDKWKREV